MFDKMQSTLVRSLSSHIFQSQREVTILFTDIEDSTRYWEHRGDIHGRLMVDRHNRILMPVVRQYHGRVLKTIGDSIMSLFASPANALHAAIAMQQALQQARESDEEFAIHVRIGLHTGDAIVEANDAFGDVVNVASRIEGEAAGDEILLSAQLLQGIDPSSFTLQHRGACKLKGKQQAVDLYCCDWQHHPNLLHAFRPDTLSPLGTPQRLESAAYALLLLACLYYCYQHILRYLLADNEPLALLLLNPVETVQRHWAITLLGASAVLAPVPWFLTRSRSIPYRILKRLKGAALAALLFVLLHQLSTLLPLQQLAGFNHPLYTTHHLFVEVQHDEAAIRAQPDEQATVLRQVDAGTILLLSTVKRRGDITWNRVLLGEQRFGWLPRIQPARVGVVEQRVSLTSAYRLRLGDLLLLLLSLPAYLWGYRSFRLRPL